MKISKKQFKAAVLACTGVQLHQLPVLKDCTGIPVTTQLQDEAVWVVQHEGRWTRGAGRGCSSPTSDVEMNAAVALRGYGGVRTSF